MVDLSILVKEGIISSETLDILKKEHGFLDVDQFYSRLYIVHLCGLDELKITTEKHFALKRGSLKKIVSEIYPYISDRVKEEYPL